MDLLVALIFDGVQDSQNSDRNMSNSKPTIKTEVLGSDWGSQVHRSAGDGSHGVSFMMGCSPKLLLFLNIVLLVKSICLNISWMLWTQHNLWNMSDV